MSNTEGGVMEAHAGAPPRLPAGLAQETIKRIRQIREELADIRHYLDKHDLGGVDDHAATAAKRIAATLPEFDSAVWWLEPLA